MFAVASSLRAVCTQRVVRCIASTSCATGLLPNASDADVIYIEQDLARRCRLSPMSTNMSRFIFSISQRSRVSSDFGLDDLTSDASERQQGSDMETVPEPQRLDGAVMHSLGHSLEVLNLNQQLQAEPRKLSAYQAGESIPSTLLLPSATE